MDIGGTDIKLVLTQNGQLVGIKEYDWNPASSPTAEGIIGPIRVLIQEAVDETVPGMLLDGLGISFPDVVIRNRIVGGEGPKTQGMRLHAPDYEAEFEKITAFYLAALSGNRTVSRFSKRAVPRLSPASGWKRWTKLWPVPR